MEGIAFPLKNKIAQLRCLSERTSNRTFPAARGFEKFSF
jgi:hypothetical protein